mmetsp:Transcript_75566/g.225246  ORF Transcript_75566/g.225246 Transcript_75566/m.225246 type:complete len:245 (-) Transcript_75566:9-743(-)
MGVAHVVRDLATLLRVQLREGLVPDLEEMLLHLLRRGRARCAGGGPQVLPRRYLHESLGGLRLPDDEDGGEERVRHGPRGPPQSDGGEAEGRDAEEEQAQQPGDPKAPHVHAERLGHHGVQEGGLHKGDEQVPQEHQQRAPRAARGSARRGPVALGAEGEADVRDVQQQDQPQGEEDAVHEGPTRVRHPRPGTGRLGRRSGRPSTGGGGGGGGIACNGGSPPVIRQWWHRLQWRRRRYRLQGRA